MQHDLLFERFLSRERRQPPDIDLDIAHERREEVIQPVVVQVAHPADAGAKLETIAVTVELVQL